MNCTVPYLTFSFIFGFELVSSYQTVLPFPSVTAIIWNFWSTPMSTHAKSPPLYSSPACGGSFWSTSVPHMWRQSGSLLYPPSHPSWYWWGDAPSSPSPTSSPSGTCASHLTDPRPRIRSGHTLGGVEWDGRYEVWCTVYCVWCMDVYYMMNDVWRIWYVIYLIWYRVYGIWCMIHLLWYMV